MEEVEYYYSTSSARASSSRWVRSFSTAKAKPLVMGCVCYDPAVSDIWDGMKAYLNSDSAGVPFDFVLFDTYEDQVRALMSHPDKRSSSIDVAWNGPVAHVMCEQQQANNDNGSTRLVSLGMRDVDRDVEAVVIVRQDAQMRDWKDLHGKRLVTGSRDSPQAHLVPLYILQQQAQIRFAQCHAVRRRSGQTRRHGRGRNPSAGAVDE